MRLPRRQLGLRLQRGSTLLKLLIALVLAGGVVAFFVLGGPQYLSLDTIRSHRAQLLAWTDEHYAQALLLALLVYVATTALSVPGAVLLSLTCGMLFGRWAGSLVILIGATAGATCAFLAARYLVADAARRKLGLERIAPATLPSARQARATVATAPAGMLARIDAGFSDNAFSYLLFLRLVPLFPFWLVNIAAAFSAVTLRTFVAATAIGILPGVFVFANLGQSLGRIESTAELMSPQTLAALALLGLFALVPALVRHLRAGTTPGAAALAPPPCAAAPHDPDSLRH